MNARAIRFDACRHQVGRLHLGAAAAALAAATGLAHADVIDDKSYFDAFPTTVISFEYDGDGNEVSLLEGQSMAMPATAYSALGVTFSPAVRWVNDGTPAFDAAQMIGGSPNNGIPGADADLFEIIFSVPVRAVGMFVINNRNASSEVPSFTAYDATGQELGSVEFGSDLIDGTIVFPNAPTIVVDYGFMGLTSDAPIARLVVGKDAAVLDDLMFTPVPAPGVVATGLATMGLLGLRRRR